MLPLASHTKPVPLPSGAKSSWPTGLAWPCKPTHSGLDAACWQAPKQGAHLCTWRMRGSWILCERGRACSVTSKTLTTELVLRSNTSMMASSLRGVSCCTPLSLLLMQLCLPHACKCMSLLCRSGCVPHLADRGSAGATGGVTSSRVSLLPSAVARSAQMAGCGPSSSRWDAASAALTALLLMFRSGWLSVCLHALSSACTPFTGWNGPTLPCTPWQC